MADAEGASVLISVPIQRVVAGVFDRPMSAIEAEYAGGIGGVRGMAGHPVDGLSRGLAGLILHGVALDEESLADAGKIQIVIQAVGRPDRALFDATMGQGGRLTAVGLAAPLLEEQAKIGVQVRLIIFDGKDVVGVVRAEVIGELALGEQGVGGEGLAGDIQGVEERDHHPDLVGLLDLVAARYGQGADFFGCSRSGSGGRRRPGGESGGPRRRSPCTGFYRRWPRPRPRRAGGSSVARRRSTCRGRRGSAPRR